MSEQPTDVASAAAGTPSIPEATNNAAEQVNSHTPETPTPPAGQHTDGGLEQLKTVVEGLAKTVDTLVGTVAKLAPRDESPRDKGPWTSWGSRRANDDE